MQLYRQFRYKQLKQKCKQSSYPRGILSVRPNLLWKMHRHCLILKWLIVIFPIKTSNENHNKIRRRVKINKNQDMCHIQQRQKIPEKYHFSICRMQKEINSKWTLMILKLYLTKNASSLITYLNETLFMNSLTLHAKVQY